MDHTFALPEDPGIDTGDLVPQHQHQWLFRVADRHGLKDGPGVATFKSPQPVTLRDQVGSERCGVRTMGPCDLTLCAQRCLRELGVGRCRRDTAEVQVLDADPVRSSEDRPHVAQARRFWSQLIRWAARPESAEELRFAVRYHGGNAVLEIDTFDREEGSSLLVKLFGRDGGTHEIRPTPLRPRHYEVDLPALESIEPRVEVAMERNGEVVFVRDEWLPQAAADARANREDPEAEPNLALLEQIAEITGGSVNASIDRILKRAPAERQITFPLAYWLALGAFGLALADIGVRHTRFQ